MKTRSQILLVALMLVATLQAHGTLADPGDGAGAALADASGDRLEAAEAEMRRVLNRLELRGADKAEALAKLAAAQAAWEAYRDAQVAAMWPFPETGDYGSVVPMCVVEERVRLTGLRTADLRAMLEWVEYDVCRPRWPE